MNKHGRFGTKDCLESITLLLLFTIFLCPVTVSADDEALYNRAHRLLNQKQYSEAQQIFSQLSDFGSDIQMGPAYQYFSAKAGYYSGYLEESLQDFNHVINRYPQSTFVSYAYFFSGNINCFLAKADLAVVAYSNAYKTSRDNKLDKLVIQSLQGLAEKVPSAVIENLATSIIKLQPPLILLTLFSE